MHLNKKKKKENYIFSNYIQCMATNLACIITSNPLLPSEYMCNRLCPHLALVFSSEGFDEFFHTERFPHQDCDSLEANQQLLT